jgi:hypothetical protein
MTETVKKKRKYNAQVQSAIGGAQVVSQPAARFEAGSEGRPLPGKPRRDLRTPEALLIEKLIDFFKTMD